jgi:hypothetical protein
MRGQDHAQLLRARPLLLRRRHGRNATRRGQPSRYRRLWHPNVCRTLAVNAVEYGVIVPVLLRPHHEPARPRRYLSGDATTILPQGAQL